MRFTPPASGSTRLSSDVWTLLCNYAMQNGNSSPREALEQLVRCAIGDAQVMQPNNLEQSDSAAASSAQPLSTHPQNAAAALDAVLSL